MHILRKCRVVDFSLLYSLMGSQSFGGFHCELEYLKTINGMNKSGNLHSVPCCSKKGEAPFSCMATRFFSEISLSNDGPKSRPHIHAIALLYLRKRHDQHKGNPCHKQKKTLPRSASTPLYLPINQICSLRERLFSCLTLRAKSVKEQEAFPR